MTDAPTGSTGRRHLVVARLRKPHGLKGEITVFPLTDAPDEVLATGRSVWVVNLAGEEVAGPFEIERSRILSTVSLYSGSPAMNPASAITPSA